MAQAFTPDQPLQPLGHDMPDFGDMEVFIDHPNTETWQGNLLFPAAKVLESLILPIINTYLQPAPDQHGFRPDHSTTSALLQLTPDIAMGLNQRKPPDPTICVAVDFSAVFGITIYCRKINRSQPPLATVRWLYCYLRRRQAKTCFRGDNDNDKVYSQN